MSYFGRAVLDIRPAFIQANVFWDVEQPPFLFPRHQLLHRRHINYSSNGLICLHHVRWTELKIQCNWQYYLHAGKDIASYDDLTLQILHISPPRTARVLIG
jgi:hypothetical protein